MRETQADQRQRDTETDIEEETEVERQRARRKERYGDREKKGRRQIDRKTREENRRVELEQDLRSQ